MSEPVGFIREVRGDQIFFFVDEGVNLCFGQIVRIHSGDKSFYARVVDAKSSSTLDMSEQL